MKIKIKNKNYYFIIEKEKNTSWLVLYQVYENEKINYLVNRYKNIDDVWEYIKTYWD